MLLYHVTHKQFQILTPTVGDARHGGEDPRAVGKPVVWLTNDVKMVRTDKNNAVIPFQHEMDIADSDPNLFMDELFDEFQKQGDALLGRKSTMRWYFYMQQLTVRQVRRWDPNVLKYV